MSAIRNIAAAIFLAASAVSAEELAKYAWEARPILIFALPGDPRLDEQLALFERARADLEDRENVVIVDTEPGSKLRERYQPSDFSVILIGKDTGEKFRRDDLVDPSELNALIDTMPMRRQEMQRTGN
ncbi:MAG: DUF4174 domain-containing protein [Pseudomonadota bacterium]